MEITYHLPLNEWYYHELGYWGLDYPPLTAYVSWFFGWVAHTVGGLHSDDASFAGIDDKNDKGNNAEQQIDSFGVCDENHSEVCMDKIQNTGSGTRKFSKGIGVLRDLVALHSSRWGFEHSGGKMYMRLTVLLCDLMIYMSAVWVLSRRLAASEVEERVSSHVWLLLTALCQPAIILIDHGHFQYNTVSLGLALWSFYFVTITTNSTKADARQSSSSSFMGPIWGSIVFSLALNFKQMELYHAPAVFAYLLGRCFRRDTKQNQFIMWTVVRRFAALGMTVILSFALLWLPFTMSSHSNDSVPVSLDGVMQILKRLFPFHRGIFEGKVANVWCALSIKPFSIRDRVSANVLPFAALGFTLALILPPCYLLFRVGRGDILHRDAASNGDGDNTPNQLSRSRNVEGSGNVDLRLLLWGTGSTSLAFFLASYQVHEKGILIPLAPISMLMVDAPNFVFFFSILATWSLWPLLVIDRLLDAYVCCIVIFLCINCLAMVQSSKLATYDEDLDIFSDRYITRYIPKLSWVGMITLHILEVTMIPPNNLPDLFPVLWSFAGCGLFCISYFGTLHAMIKHCNSGGTRSGTRQRTKMKPSSISPVSVLSIFLLTCTTSEGFLLGSPFRNSNAPIICANILLSIGQDCTGDIITEDFLSRAMVSLEWERKNAQEALPVLDLSTREHDSMSTVSTANDTDELVDRDVDDWIDGNTWKITEQHLVDMDIVAGNETIQAMKLTSHQMLVRAPQLYRLPTSQVIDAAHFLLSYPSGEKSAALIEADPSLLTYLADDLQYGLHEYLPNMMFMGNDAIAAQMIETQLSISPSFALQLIRMAVDGGIEERVSMVLLRLNFVQAR
jgi:alpha-1,3-glucosyltransferase